MIYSIVPIDQIVFDKQQNNAARMEVMLQGERVVLVKNDNLSYTIERLISTNPKAYLMSELMPGTLIMAVAAKKDSPEVVWEIVNNNSTMQIK